MDEKDSDYSDKNILLPDDIGRTTTANNNKEAAAPMMCNRNINSVSTRVLLVPGYSSDSRPITLTDNPTEIKFKRKIRIIIFTL